MTIHRRALNNLEDVAKMQSPARTSQRRRGGKPDLRRGKPSGRPTGAKIMAIAGGKGGIGKTVLTASIGVGLAALGKRVILVDADFAGANLHTCLGILEPERTFYDFFSLEVESLVEVLLDTPIANLKLISGACGTLGLANPRYTQKLRFIRELKALPGDFVLIDLGAGSSNNVLDYFLASDEGVVVTTPDPMALQECFGFIKLAVLRKLQREFARDAASRRAIENSGFHRSGPMFRPLESVVEELSHTDRKVAARLESILRSYRVQLILNRVGEAKHVKEGLAICTAARELLGVDVDYLGPISDDPTVRKAVKEFRPFLLEDTSSPAAHDLAKLITLKILEKGAIRGLLAKRKLRKSVEVEASDYNGPEISAIGPICSYSCFYWGECEYQDGGQPCRVRKLQYP